MSALPKDYFSPVKEFQRELCRFCWDVEGNERRENRLLEETESRMAEDDSDCKTALLDVAAERPILVEEPCLKINPGDILVDLAEQEGGDLVEALNKARAQNPELAALSDAFEANRDLFVAACRRAGMLGGDIA